MKGIIGLERHRISCIIGVEDRERVIPQDIYVDLKVLSSFARCAATDHIADTIDYEYLANMCTRLACEKQYKLIETFAYDVIQALIREFNIEWAWIKIWKPRAILSAEYTYVELEHKLGAV